MNYLYKKKPSRPKKQRKKEEKNIFSGTLLQTGGNNGLFHPLRKKNSTSFKYFGNSLISKGFKSSSTGLYSDIRLGGGEDMGG